MVKADEVSELFETVVNNNYCIGCGACTAVQHSPINVTLDEYGQFQAVLDPQFETAANETEVLAVCPFSNTAQNEDELGKQLYGNHANYHNEIGYHLTTYAGYVAEANFRALGSSGGVAKWVLYELLRNDLVDVVIQVESNVPKGSDELLYKFTLSTSADEVRKGAKSVYYPVEMSEVLRYVRDNPGRYAITGVPCFIKAVRLLSKQEPVFAQRILFCVGIICGHLKSTRYADMMAWQLGTAPGELHAVDFRKKLPGRKANEKGVEVRTREQPEQVAGVATVQELFGTNYGYGFFKYNACDFCDDVVAETADISVGDAWLPEYLGEGTSIMVVRNKRVQAILEQGLAAGKLKLDEVTPDQVATSQAAGLRHRREGLAYRLYLKDAAKAWRPVKRVTAQHEHISEKRRQVYEHRILLMRQSHKVFAEALRQQDFELFREQMSQLIADYYDIERTPWRRLLKRVTDKLGLTAFINRLLSRGS